MDQDSGRSTVELRPIGVIRTPFTELAGMPIQPVGAAGVKGRVEVFEDYRAGLKDLGDFSHVILIYHFHQSRGFKLEVVPFMDSEPRGLFATRAPKRPNPIGLSIVRLERVSDSGVLHVEGADILDGTPLLDIKPYVPEFDSPEKREKVLTGWLGRSRRNVADRRSDDRFK